MVTSNVNVMLPQSDPGSIASIDVTDLQPVLARRASRGSIPRGSIDGLRLRRQAFEQEALQAQAGKKKVLSARSRKRRVRSVIQHQNSYAGKPSASFIH